MLKAMNRLSLGSGGQEACRAVQSGLPLLIKLEGRQSSLSSSGLSLCCLQIFTVAIIGLSACPLSVHPRHLPLCLSCQGHAISVT